MITGAEAAARLGVSRKTLYRWHHEGRLHLRIDPRRDGEPWLIETTSLALALDDAGRRIGDY